MGDILGLGGHEAQLEFFFLVSGVFISRVCRYTPTRICRCLL